MPEVEGRRPLKVRDANCAPKIAGWLSNKNITPNQISVTNILFAALAAGCLLALPYGSRTLTWLSPVCAAIFIQCRLLCNLFDGMVAVERGKSTASGELYNDIPDRIADPLILVAAGYSTTLTSWNIELGWRAGVLSVLTAYIRPLAVGMGAPANFQGPMAKQHRMALITFASIVTALEPILWNRGWALTISLCIIIVGCIATAWNRIRSAYIFLENK